MCFVCVKPRGVKPQAVAAANRFGFYARRPNKPKRRRAPAAAVFATSRREDGKGGRERNYRARYRNDVRGSATERERRRGQSVNVVHAYWSCLSCLASRSSASSVARVFRDQRSSNLLRTVFPLRSDRVASSAATYIYVAVRLPVQTCG